MVLLPVLRRRHPDRRGQTAFHGRTAGHTFNINATTATRDGFEEERDWSRSFWSALQPHHTGVYVNFLMDEGQQRVHDAYGSVILAAAQMFIDYTSQPAVQETLARAVDACLAGDRVGTPSG